MAIKTSYWPMGRKFEFYNNNQVIFESAIPGSYSFIPKKDCVCEFTVVGGGAGGAFNSSSNRSSSAPGSSGSGCIVMGELQKGIPYTIVVGDGGAPSGWKDADTFGGSGENSKIIRSTANLIDAPGGNGGHVWWPNAAAEAIAPNFCAVSNLLEPQILVNHMGKTGGINTGPGGASVIAGTDYGHGGSSTTAGGSSTATAGKPGYVKIVYKKLKKKYKKYTFTQWTQPVLTGNGTVGGSSYACEDDGHYGNQFAYLAFDDQMSTNWNAINGTMPHYLTFYSPVTLKVQNVKIYTTASKDCVVAGEIQGSNSNINWTTLASFDGITDSSQTSISIPVTTKNLYKYIRTKITKTSGGYGWIYHEQITAQISSGSIDGTKSDYDFIAYE